MHKFLISLMCLVAMYNANAGELVIGQVGYFNNDSQSVAAQLKSGIELYFESVNKDGGIHGNRLNLVTKERGPDNTSVVAATRQLVKDAKPIALAGMVGTGPTEALVKQNVLSELGVPVIGIRTGASSLHQPMQPWLFHTRAGYAAEAKKSVTYLATMGYKRFAIFAEASTFGEEGTFHFMASLKEAGLALVSKGTYAANSAEIAGAVSSISQGRPDAILAVGNSNAVAAFHAAYRSTNKGVPIIALSTVDARAVIKQIGPEAAHGLGIACVVPDPGNRRTAIVREFQDVGQRLRGDKFARTQAELEGYIAARVIGEALRKVGPDPSSKKLRAALESIKALDMGGMVLGFSSTDHSGSRYVDVGVIGQGGRVLH